MKFTSIILCAALLLLLFAGCTTTPNTETVSEASVAAVDDAAQIALEEQIVTAFYPCMDTQDGFYYGYGSLLYFCPKDGDCFVPLCGKPNCKHNDVNCNAAIDSMTEKLGYYNGAIYSLDEVNVLDFKFAQRNLDGTDHKTIATVDLSKYGFRSEDETGITIRIDYYRGKAYFTFYKPWEEPGEHVYHMVVLNLADGSQTEFGTELFRTGGIEIPSFRNGKIYGFAVHNMDLASGKEDHTLMEVDLETGAATEIPLPAGEIWGVDQVTDSTVYYEEQVNPEEESSPLRFREYDRASGAVKDCELPIEITTDNFVLIGNDYYYVMPGFFREKSGNLYFLTRDYKLVDQIELREGLQFLAATKDRVYFVDRNVDPEAQTDVYVYYLEKSQIGSHSLSLEKLTVMVPTEAWNYYPE